MGRKLFCELSPLTYEISRQKCILSRHITNFASKDKFAKAKSILPLPHKIYSHSSFMRRKLGSVDMALQENKVHNLSLAVPLVNGVLIYPGEIFSFWNLVGNTTRAKGYKTGLAIKMGSPSQDVGGGMCQFTNLIHWMVLHTPLNVVERHQHDQLDLFPDCKRNVPFGLGTSIVYNYFDYRFQNNTTATYQIFIYQTKEFLCGEIRSNQSQSYQYQIYTQDEFFSKEEDGVYRKGNVFREKLDTASKVCIEKILLQKNHAKVTYDTSGLKIDE